MKLLILNADDFGADPAINVAVAQAHTQGLLTSASLMITAPHAPAAIEFARQHPRLGVGLHLCLTEGRPAAPAAQVRPLLGADGELSDSPFRLSARLTVERGVAAAVAAELRAQLEKFIATGLRPTHLDAHMHVQLNPYVLEMIVRLAREYQVHCVRAPVEPVWLSIVCGRGRLPRKLARGLVTATLGRRCRRVLRSRGLLTADRTVGILDPGHQTEEFLQAWLSRMPEGLTEIFFHPATETTARLADSQRGYEHAAELRALCSARLRDLIGQRGIRLVNYRELTVSPR